MQHTGHSQQKFKPINQSTIAQLNKVSIKESVPKYTATTPFRVQLPEYFNIPAFKDPSLSGSLCPQFIQPPAASSANSSTKQDVIFKKRMKDLSVLAEGMKRAKNIKEESRYHFTQGVLLHNVGHYLKAVESFEKFMKIVIYLQDFKSVELGLNVVGAAYMFAGDYTKAIQFHTKQGQISERADKFLSYVNIGLCYELIGNYKQAYINYQNAQHLLTSQAYPEQQKQQRSSCLLQIFERIEQKIKQTELFMTENPNMDMNLNNTFSSNTHKSKSPNKSAQNSILKEESILLLKKSSTKANRKEYEENKLKYAIHAAEENIDEYLKSSIVYEAK